MLGPLFWVVLSTKYLYNGAMVKVINKGANTTGANTNTINTKGAAMPNAKVQVVTNAQVVALVKGLCAKIKGAGYPATLAVLPTRVSLFVAGYKPQKLVLGINYPKTSGLIATSSPLYTKGIVTTMGGNFSPRGSLPYGNYGIASGKFTLAQLTKAATAALAPLFTAQK